VFRWKPAAVGLGDLDTSMVANEDIRARNGLLLLTKGEQVSYPILERLRSFATEIGIVEPIQVLLPQGPRTGPSGHGHGYSLGAPYPRDYIMSSHLAALPEVSQRLCKLPAFWPVAARIWEGLDARAGRPEITPLISLDAAITAEILVAANSPVYGFSSSIYNVHEALTILEWTT